MKKFLVFSVVVFAIITGMILSQQVFASDDTSDNTSMYHYKICRVCQHPIHENHLLFFVNKKEGGPLSSVMVAKKDTKYFPRLEGWEFSSEEKYSAVALIEVLEKNRKKQ